MTIDISEHNHYLTDQVRLSAFSRAINETVKPDAVVLDLGAGTGILGLMACRAGAKRVYSVDSGAIIELARSVCRVNGYSNQVIHIKENSLHVSLTEKVDVVVADQIGYFGFEAGLLEYFPDARKRLLKPGGVLIPSSLDLLVAPIEYQDKRDEVESWNASPGGFDFSPARTIAVNTSYPISCTPDRLLGEPVKGISLDLSVAGTESFGFDADVTAIRSGILHGVAGWFSAQLSPGVVMTNSPLAKEPIGRSIAFFPIDRQVSVERNDRIKINMRILPADRIVTWKVSVWTGSDRQQARTEPVCKDTFTHSTWHSMLITRDDLRRSNPAFVQKLTPRGQALLAALGLCDGRRTLAEVEQEVFRRYADLFHSIKEAQVFVAEVVTRYSE